MEPDTFEVEKKDTNNHPYGKMMTDDEMDNICDQYHLTYPNGSTADEPDDAESNHQCSKKN